MFQPRTSHDSAVATLYLSAPEVAELIRRKGLAACLAGIAANIREDFCRWPEFDKVARVPSHSPHGVIELMPVADAASYGFKYVNGHPQNHRFGLPTVMAFGLLADMDTGAPQLLTELTLTTALRTAAMSVVAAKALARPDSRVMAVIGNGAQSEFQALAFQHALGIEALRLFDIDPRWLRAGEMPYDVTADGERLLMAREAEGLESRPKRMVLVQNWESELAKPDVP